MTRPPLERPRVYRPAIVIACGFAAPLLFALVFYLATW